MIPKNKLGVSMIIGYVLLITFAIVMGGIIYGWLRSYVPTETLGCEEGVSVFIRDVKCEDISGNYFMYMNLSNNGRFGVDGYFIKSANSPGQQVATFDIAQKAEEGVALGTNFVFFHSAVGSEEKPLGPGDRADPAKYNLGANPIYLIEVTPFRYEVIEGKNKLAICTDAKVKETVNCV